MSNTVSGKTVSIPNLRGDDRTVASFNLHDSDSVVRPFLTPIAFNGETFHLIDYGILMDEWLI